MLIDLINLTSYRERQVEVISYSNSLKAQILQNFTRMVGFTFTMISNILEEYTDFLYIFLALYFCYIYFNALCKFFLLNL